MNKNPDNHEAQPRAEPKNLFAVRKADEEKHIVFGWASIAKTPDGKPVEDYQQDIIEIDDLENAVYEYVELYRDGGEMHERGGVAVLVESVIFTKEKMAAMGIPEGVVPYGWWIGLKVTEDEVWQRLKNGDYKMFSIEGTAQREKAE